MSINIIYVTLNMKRQVQDVWVSCSRLLWLQQKTLMEPFWFFLLFLLFTEYWNEGISDKKSLKRVSVYKSSKDDLQPLSVEVRFLLKTVSDNFKWRFYKLIQLLYTIILNFQKNMNIVKLLYSLPLVALLDAARCIHLLLAGYAIRCARRSAFIWVLQIKLLTCFFRN